MIFRGAIYLVNRGANSLSFSTVLSGSDNEPLIGASVRAVATNAGTSTDIDGNFTIKVPQGSDLQVSYIGYEPQTLKAQPSMTITLKENSTS